jgi:nucleotide-binding universal stress UspA family protein
MSAPVLAAADPRMADAAVVRFAAAVAGHTGAPLIVAAVHAGGDAVDPLAAGQHAEPLPAAPGDALDRMAREAARAGVEADTLWIAATTAARGLDLAAGEAGAGLLVVGSAAEAPMGRVARGCTADRLLAGAPCAVALVPPGWIAPAGLRVGVGFVDSAEGRAALRGAHALASRSGGRLRILAVVRPRDEVRDADLRARAEQAAEAAASGLLGAPVDIDVAVADPSEALARCSAELDVLVCGARGYGASRGALLGGVTQRLTTTAVCPVIVLAREPDAPLEALTDVAAPG